MIPFFRIPCLVLIAANLAGGVSLVAADASRPTPAEASAIMQREHWLAQATPSPAVPAEQEPVVIHPSAAPASSAAPPSAPVAPASPPAPAAPALSPPLAPAGASGPVVVPPSAAPAPEERQPEPPKYPEVAEKAAAMQDIHDIYGPVAIRVWSWTAFLIFLAGLLLALVLGGIFIYLARKSLRPARIKLPHEVALERLEAMRAGMTPERVREFVYGVSEIVREYIELRFHARAAHRTTEEFLRDLVDKPNSSLSGYTGLLEDFLTNGDLVKFAQASLTFSEMETMLESAIRFVSDTAPKPQGPEPVPSANSAAMPPASPSSANPVKGASPITFSPPPDEDPDAKYKPRF
jgi:hypothetical protein